MLLKLSKEIGECYRLAAETREKASAHADPVIRQHYLDMEQRWLLLAHSYTFLERLTAFTAAKPRGRKRRLDEIIRPGHLLQGTDAFPEDALDEQKLLDRLSPPAASPGSKGDEDVPAPVKIEDCTLDLAGHTFVDGSGREVRLTRAETALVTAFVHSPRRVLSRDQLRYAVAGRGAESHDRSVDMLVARLRRKIEPDPKTPRFILSVPGVGYKFRRTGPAERREWRSPLSRNRSTNPDAERPFPASTPDQGSAAPQRVMVITEFDAGDPEATMHALADEILKYRRAVKLQRPSAGRTPARRLR